MTNKAEESFRGKLFDQKSSLGVPASKMPVVPSHLVASVYCSQDRKMANCCHCNDTGICQNCWCVTAGQLCIKCFPRRLGHCLNQTDLPTIVSPKVTATVKASSLSPPTNSGTFPASPQQSSAPVVLTQPSLLLLTSTFELTASLSQPHVS